jgi:diadenosine tetraphosphate (Ap4A) HIT family hydrolase
MFELHTQLDKDTVPIGDLALCRVLLMNDANYPWLILVPRRAATSEIFQLTALDQQQLMQEVSAVSAALAAHYRADKINVAALGNVVPQLHVHVIARYQDDAAWPRPVWGAAVARAYAEDMLVATVEELRDLLVTEGLDAVR